MISKRKGGGTPLLFRFIVLVITLSNWQVPAFSQRKEISLVKMLELAATQDTVFTYANYTIIIEQPIERAQFGSLPKFYWLKAALGSNPNIKLDSAGRPIIWSGITLFNCAFEFSDDQTMLHLWDLVFERELTIIGLTSTRGAFSLKFLGGVFNQNFYYEGNGSVELTGCAFGKKARVLMEGDQISASFVDCEFFGGYDHRVMQFRSGWLTILPDPKSLMKPVAPPDTLWDPILVVDLTGKKLAIVNCIVKSQPGSVRGIQLSGQMREIAFSDNDIEGYVVLDCDVETRVNIRRNYIAYGLDLTALGFADKYNVIDWEGGGTLDLIDLYPVPRVKYYVNLFNDRTVDEVRAYAVYDGQDYDSTVEQHHFNLIGVYRNLSRLFKESGRMSTSNESYVAMKDIETRWHAYQYHAHGGFRNWSEWKLNQLLHVFTLYGTDPADAMVSAVYIIVIFGVFYFFFPSDWDPRSKKQLLDDARVLIQKNEHGYWRPFWKLLLGFIVSMINALTLSLNAFITLGFGNIPTHGIARYVCVVQGFIGWFLLSIFTVALINQILG